MSALVVQNAIIDILRTNSVLDTEFSTTLTGLLTSSGTAVTGDANTLFTTELKAGDFIGDIAHGYREVMVITDFQTLTLGSAFLSEYAGEAVKRTDINRSMPTNLNLTEIGKTLRIVLIIISDINDNASGDQIMVGYGFHFVLGFYEPRVENTDERISAYDVMLRNAVDLDPTFGNICIGNTDMDAFDVQESYDAEGVYIGILPVLCFKHETRGNR